MPNFKTTRNTLPWWRLVFNIGRWGLDPGREWAMSKHDKLIGGFKHQKLKPCQGTDQISFFNKWCNSYRSWVLLFSRDEGHAHRWTWAQHLAKGIQDTNYKLKDKGSWEDVRMRAWGRLGLMWKLRGRVISKWSSTSGNDDVIGALKAYMSNTPFPPDFR